MPIPKRSLALVVVVIIMSLAACGSEDEPLREEPGGDDGVATGPVVCTQDEVTTESGLKIEDLECGEGDEAGSGDVATVHYVGTLEDGTKFDASRDHGQPFSFTLGGGDVIAGWDEGVQGMQVGGKRTLTIPPELGYGAAGAGDVIPPNATLIFEVELLEIEEPQA